MTQEDYFAQGMLPPEMGLEVADGIMQNLNPQLRPTIDGLTSEISGQLADITDEELDQVIQLVQQLYDEPDNYAQNRAALIQSGELTEEDLPPEYDPEALAMMLYVLRKEQQARSGGMSMQPPSSMPPMAGAAPPEMQPPQGFARGGIAEAARLVANSGRFGDTMLAHITPSEARLLRKHGGSGTINPKTGLPEFIKKFLKKLWNVVWKPVKKVLNTTVGKIIANVALNILIPGFGSIIASGLTTAAAGGDFGDIVKNMAIAGVTSYLSGGLAKQGFASPIQGQLNSLADTLKITSDVGREALAQGVVSTGMGLVQGQDLKEAATSGIMAAGTVQASNAISKFYDDFKGARASGAPGKAPVFEAEIDPIDGRIKAVPVRTSDYSPNNTGVPAYASSSGTTLDVDAPAPAGGVRATSSTTNQPQIDARSSTPVAPAVNAGSSTGTGGVNPQTSTPYQYPEIGKSVGEIFSADPMKGLKNTFMPEAPTTTQLLDSPEYRRLVDVEKFTPQQALAQVGKDLTPGVVRTYGPAAAAGLGIMAMAGGFSPPGGDGGNPNGPQFRGPTGEDLLKQNPNKYLVQGLPGVNYDAQGNIIGNNNAYPYATMNDIQVASNYGTQARFADGGEVMPDYLAEGGTPRIRPMGIPNLRDMSRFAPYMKNMPVRIMGKEVQIGIPNIPSSMMGGVQGVAARMKAKRDAEAAAAAQAAATAAANAPGQANKLYAANPDQYRPSMEQPQQYAYGGDVMPEYLAQGGTPNKNGTRQYGPYVFDPNSPRMVEYRNMAQSLTPAARQYIAQNSPRGVVTDMNMMRQAMAYSDQEATRRAPGAARNPGAANSYYAENPEKYRPNMTAPAGGIAGLAQGGYPRRTGQISGPGTETSDSIPAMLSDGEFVMTAKAVRGLGKGSRREGAKKMYALMHQLERNAARG
jgi:hypothetical protein